MTDDQPSPPLGEPPGAGGAPRHGSPAGPADPRGTSATQRLTRSRRHKLVGGVCGGLGRHFDLDPVVFRVPLTVLSVVGGLGLVLYAFAWLLLPEEGERENEFRGLLSGRVEGSSLSAILMALVGCGLALASLRGPYTSFSLLVVGAVLGAAYWSQRRRRAEAAGAGGAPVDQATAQAVAEAPPETQAPPVPSTPSWWREPLTKDTGYLWGPDHKTPYTADHRAEFRRRRRCERQSFGGLLMLAATIAAVLAAIASWPAESLADSAVIALGSALLVFGAGIAVSAFAGRTGFGTIFLVVCTAMLLAGASVLPQDITARWADARWSPAAATDVRPRYEIGTGRGVLDLTAVRPGGDRTVRTSARVGAGQLRVLVPDDVTVLAEVDVGAGAYWLPGGPAARDSDSPGGGLDITTRRTLRPEGGVGATRGTLVLDLHVGLGEVVVDRRPHAAERPVLPPVPEAPPVGDGPAAGHESTEAAR